MNYQQDIKAYFERVKETIDKVSTDDLNTLMNILNQARDENDISLYAVMEDLHQQPHIIVVISTKVFLLIKVVSSDSYA